MSCGQIAIEKLGITEYTYYASEIDIPAMAITMSNYPDTKQLGDVSNIKAEHLPESIDLLLAGSPCQGFSLAGKQLAFKDERSVLFFEFIRILELVKPKYFLLENVFMKREFQDIISAHVGVEPIMINSNLVSAQNRKRLYWTNIPNIRQPKDKGILLKDIMESDDIILNKYRVNRTKSREKMWAGKCKNITHEDKSSCLNTKQDRWNNAGLIEYRNFCRFLTLTECERLQTVPDNYTYGLSDTQRYKMLGNGWTIDIIAHILKDLVYLLGGK